MTSTNEKVKQQLREKLETGDGALVLSTQMSEIDARTIAAEVGRESDIVVISPSMPASRVCQNTDEQDNPTNSNTNKLFKMRVSE